MTDADEFINIAKLQTERKAILEKMNKLQKKVNELQQELLNVEIKMNKLENKEKKKPTLTKIINDFLKD